MKIAQHPDKYFCQNQYLLADSAYANSQHTIPAYKGRALEDPDIKKFNTYLAKSRVRNEHAIGILKGRWSSLREMRNQLRSPKELTSFIDWVIVCVILHNMLAKIGDEWIDLYHEEAAPDEVLFTTNDNQSSLLDHREKIKNHLLDFFPDH